MAPHDVEYYRERAIVERALAKASDQANVAEIHEKLARQYEALVDQVELSPTLRIKIPTRPSA